MDLRESGTPPGEATSPPGTPAASVAGGAGPAGAPAPPGPARPAGLLPAVLWTTGYLALAALPLLVLLATDVPRGLGLWWDVSLGLGFSGLAVMVLQFALTARFRSASAPFGSDILYYFHRWMAVGGLALLFGHWLVLRVTAPEALAPALPWGGAPWTMTAGRVALFLFAALVVTSLWRKPLGLEYDRWRVAHALMAVAAVLLAAGHVFGAGYYTEAPAMRGLLLAYTAGWMALVLHVRVLKPWRMLARPYRVVSVRPERSRAWTLALEPVGHPGLSFSPGQFVWLTLGGSPFRAKEHPFSLSGSAAPGKPLEVTIKELGDFTNTVGRTLPGTVAYLDGPQGVFTPDRHPDAPGFVFVAGGVGIAPIMSMLRTMADRGERRPLRLIYGNESWDGVIFREELEELGSRLPLTVTHVLVEPPAGWTGERGLVGRELLERVLPENRRRLVYFLCGPEPMSDAVQDALGELGVPLGRVHSELFDMV